MIDLARKRIEAMDVRLESRRKHLERQFTAMESALAQLQGQGGALSALSNNIALMNNMFARR
jgi:flagellar capping protein FliD